MLIKNAKILTFDQEKRIINDGGIEINSEGQISKVFNNKSQYTKRIEDGFKGEVIDADGQFLMPGNICAHTHFYGAYSRGMYIPGDAPDAFPGILENLWWKLDKALDSESTYFSAMVCLIDAIRTRFLAASGNSPKRSMSSTCSSRRSLGESQPEIRLYRMSRK